MKRKIGMLFAAVLAAATLAACGSNGSSGSASSSTAQSGSAASSASAETITLKLATKMSEDSTEGIAFQHFADLVNEYTNGEVFVQVYSNELLQTAVDEDVTFLEENGATINMDFDVAPLREKLADYYQGYIDDGTIPSEVAEILGLN